jgi:HSP20 family protein
MAGTKSSVPVRQGSSTPLNRFDPFTSFRREMDRLFDDFSRGWPGMRATFPSRDVFSALRPSMDVAKTDREFEITAELPGLRENEVQVDVTNDILTVKDETKAEKEENDKNYHVVERSYGSFSRSLQLPPGIDPEQITATLSNGVLRVVVPKPAAGQSKRNRGQAGLRRVHYSIPRARKTRAFSSSKTKANAKAVQKTLLMIRNGSGASGSRRRPRSVGSATGEASTTVLGLDDHMIKRIGSEPASRNKIR